MGLSGSRASGEPSWTSCGSPDPGTGTHSGVSEKRGYMSKPYFHRNFDRIPLTANKWLSQDLNLVLFDSTALLSARPNFV